MWWLVILASILAVVAVVAVVTERRRSSRSSDPHADVERSGEHRVRSWAEKEGDHGGTMG